MPIIAQEIYFCGFEQCRQNVTLRLVSHNLNVNLIKNSLFFAVLSIHVNALYSVDLCIRKVNKMINIYDKREFCNVSWLNINCDDVTIKDVTLGLGCHGKNT